MSAAASAVSAYSAVTALTSVPTNALAMLLAPVIAASLTTVPLVKDSEVGANRPPTSTMLPVPVNTTSLMLNGKEAAGDPDASGDADAGSGGGNDSRVGANRPPTSKGAGGKPASLVAGAAAARIAATACSMSLIVSFSGREKIDSMRGAGSGTSTDSGGDERGG